jgi:tyrosyl-tRNA synthetase
MSIPDTAMPEYFRLLLHREPPGVSSSARDAKHELARALVSWLHGEPAAEEAARHFERVTVRGETPEEIEEAVVAAGGDSVHLPAVMQDEFGISRSEARRLIDQGGVTLGGEPLAPGEHDVPAGRVDGQVLRVGKRRFRRLRVA